MKRFRLLFQNKITWLAFFLFLFYTGWWIILPHSTNDNVPTTILFWGATYQVIALLGTLYGLTLFESWGGLRSIMGRGTLMFSLGLLFQLLGQSISTYYVLQGVGVPYPSLGDIGFFGSIFFYSYGAILFAKASGAHVSLRSYTGKLQVLVVPLVLLIGSGFIFLKDYQFDWSQPLVVFLDFGYPLGQAFYVSMAILAFFLSRKTLGGMMQVPILFFIAALIAQYAADFTFLYQSHAGTYLAGGFDDYLYLLSYFIMAMSLIQLGITLKQIKNS